MIKVSNVFASHFSMKQKWYAQTTLFAVNRKFPTYLIISFVCAAYVNKILWTLCLVFMHGPHHRDSSIKYLGTIHDRVGIGCYTHWILKTKYQKYLMHLETITQNLYHVESIYSDKKWRFAESVRLMTWVVKKVEILIVGQRHLGCF